MKTRAKIVCTLGPSSNDVGTMRALIEAGMNVARLNFSHGSHEQHRQMVANLRQASQETGSILGILLDLQGPKVRVGRFAEGSAQLVAGAPFTITTRAVTGNAHRVSTTYRGLPGDLGPGKQVLLDDGLIVLEVRSVQGEDILCEVVTGGVLKDSKGINVPGAALSVETITAKDYADVDFGLTQQIDYLAMSFVRHPDDIRLMRAYLKNKPLQPPIIAKIEKPQALEHLEAIVDEADGIMVARGDLGVELPPEAVPAIQKRLISTCNARGKPVITATQMLESMVHNPRPTRAEASDVANAVLDGSDAVMLSAESATGKYPVQAVEVMRRIIHATETATNGQELLRRRRQQSDLPVHEGIAISACSLAESVNAQAIVSVTLTGSMARFISKHRPSTPVYAVSQFEHALRQLVLYWGVEGILMPDLTTDIDAAVLQIEQELKSKNLLRTGEAMVLTAGLPFSERQATNMVRVDTVG